MATVRASITGAGATTGYTVHFHGWGDGSGNGWLPALMAIPDRFRRPGGNGSGRQHNGTESPSQNVPVVIWCQSLSVAKLAIDALEHLAGYPVQLTDPYGRTLTVQIDRVDVRPRSVRGPIIAAGIQATHRVAGILTVERLV